MPTVTTVATTGFNLRAYSVADDAEINNLEKSAVMQFRFDFLTKLISTATEHKTTFDGKVRQYKSGEVIVACDVENGESIAGVITVGIKDVFIQGKPARIGFLSNLRVHERIQRRGLASLLIRSIEERCLASQCTHMLLTVNGSNARARQLFARHNYSLASKRRLTMTPLWFRYRPDPAVQEMSSVAGAVARTAEHYGKRDMALADFQELFSQKPFLGMFTLEDEATGSKAGACLWDASTLRGFAFQGHIPAFISRPGVLPALSTAACSMAAYRAFSLWTLWPELGCFMFVLRGLFDLSVAIALWAVYSVLRFALVERKLRIFRIIAPYAEGPEGQTLLKRVANHIKHVARDRHGAAVIMINMADGDPLTPVLGKTWGPPATHFLIKPLLEGQPATPLAADGFFDPRDI